MTDPAILRRTEHARGRFLLYQTITWRDAAGREREWESVERAEDHGAVMTIPWLRPSDRLLLIRQYRPPAGGYVVEFPAGIVDAGEDPDVAAVRELREETGYTGRVTARTPPTFNTPGLSGETVWQVFMEVDEADPANADPAQALDETEMIEVLRVPRGDLAGFLDAEMRRGSAFDSKLAAYIQGLAGREA